MFDSQIHLTDGVRLGLHINIVEDRIYYEWFHPYRWHFSPNLKIMDSDVQEYLEISGKFYKHSCASRFSMYDMLITTEPLMKPIPGPQLLDFELVECKFLKL